MERLKGIAMILIGAMLWGASGPLMEWTMEVYGISVPFLLTIRLTVAGLFLLLFLKLRRADYGHFPQQNVDPAFADIFRIGNVGCPV